MKKSMKIFATKEDLQNIFLTFQQNFTVYYVPTYSQQKNIRINNILIFLALESIQLEGK